MDGFRRMSNYTQPEDFRSESQSLYTLLKDVDEAKFDEGTLFKGWTINDVLTHLHFWNYMADLSMVDEDKFVTTAKDVMKDAAATGSLRNYENTWRGDRKGKVLLEEWHSFFNDMADHFAAANPKMRLKWVGPDMSARSSITARLMETWAHGQAVFDALGVVREDGDRIKNIVILSVNTFGFNHKINRLDVPEVMPYLRLTAPSGQVWEFGDPSDENRIEGSATEFCQTTTQTRNVADTDLKVSGPVATKWMSIAQCFAGGAETPPAPGQRRIAG